MCSLFHLYQSRGLDLYHEDKLEEAIAEWRIAADIDPEDGYVLNNIGAALSRLGQEEAAIEEWRKAVRLEPDCKEAAKSLAQSLSKAGLLAEALAVTRAAIRHNPDDGALYSRLGYYLRTEADKNQDGAGWEASAAAFRKSLEIDPTDSFTLRSFASLQWILKKKREAIETLKDAISVNPDDAEAHVQLIRYQSYRKHFRGMYQTIVALNTLPDSEALDQYFSDMNKLAEQVKTILLIGAGLVGVVIGGWAWYRQRG